MYIIKLITAKLHLILELTTMTTKNVCCDKCRLHFAQFFLLFHLTLAGTKCSLQSMYFNVFLHIKDVNTPQCEWDITLFVSMELPYTCMWTSEASGLLRKDFTMK